MISQYKNKFRMFGNVNMRLLLVGHILAYQCTSTRNGSSWNYFYTHPEKTIEETLDELYQETGS